MTGFGSMSQLLDAYVPVSPAPEQEWEDVLFRAELLAAVASNGTTRPQTTLRARSSRRPWLIALAGVAAVVLLVPLIALAAGYGWWFERPGTVASHGVKPLAGRLSEFANGNFGGQRWTAVAYVSKDPSPVYASSPPKGRLVCVSVILGKLTNNPTGPICAAPIGMTDVRHGPAREWVLNSFPLYWPLTVGIVARDVSRVVVVVVDRGKRTTIDVPLVRAPAVGGGIRFFALAYATALNTTARIESISAYSSSGTLLQHNNTVLSSRG